MNNEVLIVDYEVGNHQSVANALARLGYRFKISHEAAAIAGADVYILPGVGSFPEAMKNLDRLNLVGILKEQVVTGKKPVLGICLGMQIMADSSEENGHHEGLGWVRGTVEKLRADNAFRVPHVGWNDLRIMKKDPLFTRSGDSSNFYFNHSYYFIPAGEGRGPDEPLVTARCRLCEDVVAAFQQDNIFGVQFHPEKSQSCGLKLFRSFFNHCGIKSSHA
ncbi:MAG: imidazole glycerol phosphate synthase subunit HisH [Candidatus Omnitrophica bacterium]|nr:imidazole glycerol phosphate synthase subunit HisH [Candidatus Omnitrophota bacterium]